MPRIWKIRLFTLEIEVIATEILYCDIEAITCRYNNVKVSQCVMLRREKTIGNCFLSR